MDAYFSEIAELNLLLQRVADAGRAIKRLRSKRLKRRKLYEELSKEIYFSTGLHKLLQELPPVDFSRDSFPAIWLLAAEELLVRLQKRLRVWNTLLYLQLFFCFFSVFPNYFRHSCTTMPWTIWPTLVVLWGVCWMFFGPSASNDDEFTGMSMENFDWSTIGLSDTSYSNLVAESDSPNFRQEQYPTLSIHDSTISRAEYRVPVLVDVAEYQFHFSIDGDNAGVIQSSDIPSVSDFPATVLTGLPFNAYDIATSTATEMHPSEAESVGVYTTSISSFPQGDPSAGEAKVNQQNEPFRNNEGRMICRHGGCENLAFNHKGEWKRHSDRHNRPFHCSECTQRFGSNFDLQRHQRSKHGQNAPFFCNELGCEHIHNGFKRKDHLVQHVRQVHKRKLEQESDPDQVTESSRRSEDGTMTASPSHKRRKRAPDLSFLSQDELIEEVLEEREKYRRLEQELGRQRERYENRIDSLLRVFEGKTERQRS